MIEWVPIVFGTFKALVLGTGMFFAIKWHYDKGKKENGTPAVRRAFAKVGLAFVLGLLVVGLIAFALVSMLHLNLSGA